MGDAPASDRLELVPTAALGGPRGDLLPQRLRRAVPVVGRAASRGVGRKAHDSLGLEVRGEFADTEAALPVLGDVDLQDAGVVGVGVVELVAVEQQHAVGVTAAPARRLEDRRER